MAAVLFVVWTAAPDRREPPALLVAILVVGAVLWGPSWAARGVEPEAGEPIRVMSWNVRRLWGGADDGGDPLQCAVEAIRSAEPDVVALLEVSRDDVDALSQALDLTCVHGTYNGSERSDRGGLASCVRGGRWRLKSGTPVRFSDPVPWFYVSTEVVRGPHVVNLLAVHLRPYDLRRLDDRFGLRAVESVQETYRSQSDQSAALLHRVASFADPTVVAGDFNSTRDTALHVGLRSHLTDVWERGGFGFGSTVTALDYLPLRVDYIYSSDAFATVSAEVPAVACSDHRPVIGDIVLR
jgi:endonuclease/exonuclease/phosphatase (EEP) superfamily protein YafD